MRRLKSLVLLGLIVVIAAAFVKTDVLAGISLKLLEIMSIANTENSVFYTNLILSVIISIIITLLFQAILYAILKPILSWFRKH